MGTLMELPLSATTLRPRDENFLEGIVDDAPLKVPNPLAKRDYIKVGTNEHFKVEPTIVHFGGYDVKSVHRTTVRITNVSSVSRRLTILPTNTPFFKMTCDKRGLVAPGMSEEVRLEFCPTEWRYYYDCLRVHSEAENLIIPIHAYPVVNDVLFPVRVDFGKCAANEVYTKAVRLECKVPIQFEYEITTEEDTSMGALSIEPNRGIIPADGFIEVTVVFKPRQLITYNQQFVVQVSQFNAEPLTCTVTGSAVPCKVRDEEMAALTAGARGTERLGVAGPTMQELEGTFKYPPPFRPGSENTFAHAGGGAGHGDAYTELVAQQKSALYRSQRAPGETIQLKPPNFPPPVEEISFRGVMLQPNLVHTPAGVQAVLQQIKGKLRMKDLQKAIEENNAKRQEQESAASAGAGAGGGGDALGWIDDEHMTQQIKEMIFAKEFNAVVDYEREVELKFNRALGGVPPTEQQIFAVEMAREHAATRRAARLKHEDQHRYVMELLPDGRATHIAGADPIPGYTPDFDIYKNRDFERRRQVVERFRGAIRRVIVQGRVARRAASLRILLAGLNYDKKKVQEAANAVFLGQSAGGEGSAVHTKPVLDNSKLREHCFPLNLESNFRNREPVEQAEILPNEVWKPMAAKEPFRYHLMNYTELPYSPFPSYLDLREDQPLMTGAEEEEEEMCPRAVLPPEEDTPCMPDQFKAPARAPYPALAERMNDDTVFTPPFPVWGLQDPYRIQPAEYTFTDTLRVEVSGCNSMSALGNVDLLSSIWLPRREDWLMEKIQIPPLMTGPVAEDVMDADPGIEKHPHMDPHQIKYPTAESIAAEFFVPTAGDACPPAVKEELEKRKAEGGAEPEPDSADGAEAAPRPSTAALLDFEYEIPRQRREADLDRAKRESRDAWVEEVLAQKAAFNELVSDTRYQFEFDRPGFPARP